MGHWLKNNAAELALLLVFMLLSLCPRDLTECLCVLALLAFILLATFVRQRPNKERVLAVFCLIRLPFLLAEPMLSDDYFRFHWDALVVQNGMSPYAFLPSEKVNLGTEFSSLFPMLNSQNYYSVYPPSMQLLFQLALLVPGVKFVFSLKFISFVFEFLLFVYIYNNARIIKLNLPKFVLVSLLPLVVVEGVGNLHFEVLMIYFFLASFILYRKNLCRTSIASGVVLAFSVLIKLTVLPLAVVFVRRQARFLLLFGTFVVVSCFMILLYVDQHAANAMESLALYFNSFEFNASIYYVVRYLGYKWVGYNIIASYGVVFKMGLILLGILVLVKSFVYKSIEFNRMVYWVNLFFLIYCLGNPTLHPWYLIVPLFFSCYTKSWFWIIWSLLIYLSYFFYKDLIQVGWWLVAEYALLTMFVVFGRNRIEKKLNHALFDQG